MARPDPSTTDLARLQRLEKTVREITAAETRLENLRLQRNELIYMLMRSRVKSASQLSRLAGVSEPYVYRCMHDKGRPKTGARA